MKTTIRLITITAALILTFGSCEDYNELVKNKNVPASAPPSVILTGLLEHMNDQNAWDGKQGSMSAAQFYVSTYDYYGTNNYDQEPFTKTKNNFEYTTVLQNCIQMELEAKKGASIDLNPYSALSKFLKAYYFNLMSQKMGDIPLSQALQAENNPSPKYDTQKDVYIKILSLLDEANADLAKIISTGNKGCVGSYCSSLAGDIYLGNDLLKWQKAVNTFTLRVLISLHKKEGDTDLKIKNKFANIVNNPSTYPIFNDLSDNIQYDFSAEYNPYPKNPTSLGRDGTRENVASTFLGLTTSLNDPRTFVAATPAPRQINNPILRFQSGGSSTATITFKKGQPHDLKVGQVVTIDTVGYGAKKVVPSGYLKKDITILSIPTDTTFTYSVPSGLSDVDYFIETKNDKKVFTPLAGCKKNFYDITAYIGAEAGLSMSDLGNYAQGGRYSYINPLRYSADFAGSKAESAIILGYPEMCFNIAEGINRGWASGDASSWYLSGISASMSFLGLVDGSLIQVGNLNGTTKYGYVRVSVSDYLSKVAYKGGNDGLTQILQQKYIAFWQNSNWEAFFNIRRTGIPAFSVGPGSSADNKIATRWQYPQAESSSNSSNYSEALQRQFGGKDDIYQKLWILQ
jgi:hypothetical protein